MEHNQTRNAVRKTPADYVSDKTAKLVIPEAPVSSIPKRQNAIWDSFTRYMNYISTVSRGITYHPSHLMYLRTTLGET